MVPSGVTAALFRYCPPLIVRTRSEDALDQLEKVDPGHEDVPNGKVSVNPARLVWQRNEESGRLRLPSR